MFGIHRLPRRRKTPVVRYSKNARCEPVSQLLTLFRRRPKPRCPSCHKWNRVYLTGGSFLLQCVHCGARSEEHTSELQSLTKILCPLLLVKKKINIHDHTVSL